MSGGTTIALSRSYEAGGKAFSELTIRPIRWADYMEIGEVQEAQPISGGAPGQVMIVEDTDKIRRYAEKLVDGVGAQALDQLELVDTLKVREAIIGFFADARASTGKRTP